MLPCAFGHCWGVQGAMSEYPHVRSDLLCESIDHLKLTPSKKEFAKAVLRRAIEYAAMREAGFVLEPDHQPLSAGGRTE